MSKLATKVFWQDQVDSLHRSGTQEFYRKKAQEHATVFRDKDRKLPVIDLGCGAGELLEFLTDDLCVEIGLDYSAKMLECAAKLNPQVKFVEADFEEYLTQCDLPVWMATGSINQYIDKSGQRRVLDYFSQNSSCQSIYLFDNVEPTRYLLTNRSRMLDYLSGEYLSRLRVLYGISRLFIRALFSFHSFEVMHLGTSMGYAYSPSFWIRECRKRNLKVEVVSSKYYEYRYHLIIEK